MPNNLDRIVTVSIDINSPLVDSSSFDNLLILGPPPAAESPYGSCGWRLCQSGGGH